LEPTTVQFAVPVRQGIAFVPTVTSLKMHVLAGLPELQLEADC